MPCPPTLRAAATAACGAALAVAAVAAAAQGSATPAKAERPRRGPPAPAFTLPPATGEQLTAAAMTHLGPYACEFNDSVSVDANSKFEGYVNVQHKKSVWIMKPVLSQTGALRLEDVKGRMLMLQIANKSMLMDVRAGQRVVDNCVHDKQRETMANRPAGESIGIDPAKAPAGAAPAAAAASR